MAPEEEKTLNEELLKDDFWKKNSNSNETRHFREVTHLINSGKLNVYEANWEEITVYQKIYIKELLELLNIDKIEPAVDAIIDSINEKYDVTDYTYDDILLSSFWFEKDYYLPPHRYREEVIDDIRLLAAKIIEKKQKTAKYTAKMSQKAQGTEVLPPPEHYIAPEVYEALKKENEDLKKEYEALRGELTEQDADSDITDAISTEFTATPRQVILFFKALGIDVDSSNVNKTRTAEFLSRLISKNQANIYVLLCRGIKENKQTQKDQQIIDEILAKTHIKNKK